jgi:hypothetical protein
MAPSQVMSVRHWLRSNATTDGYHTWLRSPDGMTIPLFWPERVAFVDTRIHRTRGHRARRAVGLSERLAATPRQVTSSRLA